jgi:metal-responsive CopG/Arc/MetJ family transcriptional regulator
MKNTTVNISIPLGLYRDAKVYAKENGYSSISELVRDALRRILYQKTTMSLKYKNK